LACNFPQINVAPTQTCNFVQSFALSLRQYFKQRDIKNKNSNLFCFLENGSSRIFISRMFLGFLIIKCFFQMKKPLLKLFCRFILYAMVKIWFADSAKNPISAEGLQQ
jgi:hypothetical protein